MQIPDDQLEKLILGGESECVEFTETITDLDKFRKAICAFANDLHNHGKPGVLFIGIKDNHECADLTIDDTLLCKLSDLRSDGKITPIPTISVSKKTLNGCEVAVVQVEPSRNPPVRFNRRCLIRTGPTIVQASSEDEKRLCEKQQVGDLRDLPDDMTGVPYTSIDDLDMKLFEEEYLPNAVSPEVLEANRRTPDDLLKALRLATPDGTPTITAILLLGKDPQAMFSGAYIQFVRYAGNEVDTPIISQKVVDGTLSSQIKNLDELLKQNIAIAMDTSGTRHINLPEYPLVALQELTRNAVIHRDYKNTNSPVRITWYGDRIEIVSPGSLYGTVTKDSFGKPGATDYRNPTIAEAAKNLGFAERFGSGLQRAKQALKENGNPPWEATIEDTFLCITLKRRKPTP